MKLQSDKAMSTEDKILDAALDVVQEHTISGTRIHLVAEYAGCFQSNIHYYFKSKRDLLLAVLHRLQRRCLDIRAELREQADAGLDAQLDIFFEQKKQFILHETKYDYAEIDFWTQAHLDEEIREQFAVSFRKWREEISRVIARYAPWVSPQQRSFLSALMVSMMEGATLQYLVDKNAFALDDYFARCKQLILEPLRQEN